MVYSAGLLRSGGSFLRKSYGGEPALFLCSHRNNKQPRVLFLLFSQTPTAQTTPFPWLISPWITSCRYTVQSASSKQHYVQPVWFKYCPIQAALNQLSLCFGGVAAHLCALKDEVKHIVKCYYQLHYEGIIYENMMPSKKWNVKLAASVRCSVYYLFRLYLMLI